jgi:hypothetical protein
LLGQYVVLVHKGLWPQTCARWQRPLATSPSLHHEDLSSILSDANISFLHFFGM